MVSIHLCGGASVKLYLGYSQCIRHQGIRVLNKSPTCTLKKDLHPLYNVLRVDFFQDHLAGGGGRRRCPTRGNEVHYNLGGKEYHLTSMHGYTKHLISPLKKLL